MHEKKKSKRGRKCKYPTHVQPRLHEIEKWCREGLIEVEICKRLGVSIRQFQEYKNKFPQLSHTLQRGKEVADYQVEDSLYKKAIGIKVTELHEKAIEGPDGKIKMVPDILVTKYLPPDTRSCIYWLINRKPEKWKK